MPAANEILHDAAINHAVDLQHYSNGVVAKIIATLNRTDAALFAELISALERLPAESFTVARLERLLLSARQMNRAAFETVDRELTADLLELTIYEGEFQAETMRAAVPDEVAIRLGVAEIVPEQVYAAAMARPFQGALLKGVLADLEATRAKRVRETIASGYVANETTDQIVRNLRGTRALRYEDGIFNRSRQDTEAVVRTAISHTAAFARERFYEANDKVIASVQWVSTLDNRTSAMCRLRDGLQYAKDTHKPIGHAVPWGAGPGALHWCCRSTSTPVLKSWKQLAGVDVGEFSQSTRASMDGQVPAETTYAQWLGKQTAARQDEILGKARGEMFRRGTPLEGFYNNKGKYLTLEQLRERSAVAKRREPPSVMEPEDVLPKPLLAKAGAAIKANHDQPEDAKPVGLTQEQKDIASRQLARSIEAAHEAKPAFDAQLDAIGAKVSGRVSVAGVKGGERLLEKHVLENNSDPANMRDLVRGSIVVHKVSDVGAVLREIERNFTVTRVKDRFAKPLATGYSDMLINVRLPSGIDGEIQVHIPEMIAAKKLGHKVYDIERKLSAGPEKDRLVQMQSEIYSAALKANEVRNR